MTTQEKIWKIIRGLGEFTVQEVAILTELNKATVWGYISLLGRAGYLRQTGKKRNCHVGASEKIWRLVKNTGPKAPEQRRYLYDRNTKETKDVA